MIESNSRRFPLTVAHLLVIRCQVCHYALACWSGNIREVLTGSTAGSIPMRSASFPVAGAGDPHHVRDDNGRVVAIDRSTQR
jgi:hypothetical protein